MYKVQVAILGIVWMLGVQVPLWGESGSAGAQPSLGSESGGAGDLWSCFANPPDLARPWCYWWWINGHADRDTITADLEAMKRLGFGGVLMFDSRGYWDDEDHVVNPKAEIGWGTEEWYDLVEFSIRECARLGLEFTMNASASGGTLNGFIDGKEYETDVMNRNEVVAHLDRAVGPLLKRVSGLVGKTFTHIYSVSYEGSVKTGGSWSAIKDNFYATMRGWAHGHGLKVYSESGGPWGWGSKSATLDCDQLDLLAHNDFPRESRFRTRQQEWTLLPEGCSPRRPEKSRPDLQKVPYDHFDGIVHAHAPPLLR